MTGQPTYYRLIPTNPTATAPQTTIKRSSTPLINPHWMTNCRKHYCGSTRHGRPRWWNTTILHFLLHLRITCVLLPAPLHHRHTCTSIKLPYLLPILPIPRGLYITDNPFHLFTCTSPELSNQLRTHIQKQKATEDNETENNGAALEEQLQLTKRQE